MKAHFLLPLALLGVLAAGCGGGGSSAAQLNASDVAVVGSQHISTTQFNQLLGEAKVNLKAQGQAFPKPGTAAYSNIKSQAVSLLVQEAEKESEAAKLGITVTPKQVATQLAKLKKQYFGGDEKKYQAQLKKQGLTDALVRENIREQLIGQKLFNSVTKNVTVSPASIVQYYDQHLSQYQTPDSRAVRYILVGKNKKPLATSLLKQLQTGGSWCTLAKKYSKDPSSSGKCGQATFTKGQTVPAFDKLAFSVKTNAVATVNTPQYGWFVLSPTAAVKKGKNSTLAEETKSIKQTLLTQDKDTAMTNWVNKIQKSYCSGQIRYQAGYQPSPDPCTATSTTTTST